MKEDHTNRKATAPQGSVNLFTEALNRLPEEEKDVQRLADEALVVIVAGSETTSRALASMIYHVMKSPDIHSTLLRELDDAIKDCTAETPYQRLEQLPYLVCHHTCIRPRIRRYHRIALTCLEDRSH